ncbi:HTH-type transcriptional regulator GbpR [Pseudoruegeria aquimaris]|uniref:HTH-type transcriptional regulator GbpR n=1 Tax=Pseudoruegeria aquimaris TaxID=393663 RepID=A0A1Y5SDE2_9RHOB|nr:LysR family transcriptional regulator [Pseudoruegeria aquimaris]SLN36621.1 HTH-type transcriptional regulator GbpR [Pseudoruegeria aquimaris]
MDLARRLKPNHLRLLLKIAETGQLQAAAHLSAISQPAASRTLADVEAALGGPLFERHPKGMEPTPLGWIFLRHAKVILEELDLLQAEAERFALGDMGRVRIGTVTGPAVGSLMPAVREVKAEAPDIEFTIEVAPSTELMRGLVEGRYDFVISRLAPGYDAREFRLHPARGEVVSLLVRPEHPLAGRRGLPLQALLRHEWVMQDMGSPIRLAVENAFHAQGLAAPRRVTNSSSLLIALAFLQGTDTIAPLTHEVANMLLEPPLSARVTPLDLATPISVSPCFVIQNRGRRLSSAAERVLARVFAYL